MTMTLKNVIDKVQKYDILFQPHSIPNFFRRLRRTTIIYLFCMCLRLDTIVHLIFSAPAATYYDISLWANVLFKRQPPAVGCGKSRWSDMI